MARSRTTTTDFLRTVQDFGQLASRSAHGADDAGEGAGTAAHGGGNRCGTYRHLAADAAIVSIVLHSAAGLAGLASAFLDPVEFDNEAVSRLLTAGCVSSAVLGGASGLRRTSWFPTTAGERLARYYNALFAAAFGMNKAIWGFAGWQAEPTDLTDYRARSAKYDAVLVIPAMVITSIHLEEMAKEAEGKDRTMAILDETSYLATYVGRVLYTAIVVGTFDSERR